MTNGTDGADWATEYQTVAQVIDLARNPDEPRHSLRSHPEGGGFLIPAGPEHHVTLKDLWDRYEANVRCGGEDRSDERLTARMKNIIRDACRKEPPSLPLEYISVDPGDYTVFELHFVPPPIYGLNIHTKPDYCHFLAWIPTEPDFSWSRTPGRLKMYRPKVMGNLWAYPFHVRTHWRALTNNKLQQNLQVQLYEFMHPPSEAGEAEGERG